MFTRCKALKFLSFFFFLELGLRAIFVVSLDLSLLWSISAYWSALHVCPLTILHSTTSKKISNLYLPQSLFKRQSPKGLLFQLECPCLFSIFELKRQGEIRENKRDMLLYCQTLCASFSSQYAEAFVWRRIRRERDIGLKVSVNGNNISFPFTPGHLLTSIFCWTVDQALYLSVPLKFGRE